MTNKTLKTDKGEWTWNCGWRHVDHPFMTPLGHSAFRGAVQLLNPTALRKYKGRVKDVQVLNTRAIHSSLGLVELVQDISESSVEVRVLTGDWKGEKRAVGKQYLSDLCQEVKTMSQAVVNPHVGEFVKTKDRVWGVGIVDGIHTDRHEKQDRCFVSVRFKHMSNVVKWFTLAQLSYATKDEWQRQLEKSQKVARSKRSNNTTNKARVKKDKQAASAAIVSRLMDELMG